MASTRDCQASDHESAQELVSTMNHDDARRLVERIGVLRHPSDLDLLLFFARHPRSLLTSGALATFLGYSLGQTAGSLDVLLAARLLTRTQTPMHAARLYVLSVGGTTADWLPSLLQHASTREGRQALIDALRSLASDNTGGHSTAAGDTDARA
jgi:hypothetical protein